MTPVTLSWALHVLGDHMQEEVVREAKPEVWREGWTDTKQGKVICIEPFSTRFLKTACNHSAAQRSRHCPGLLCSPCFSLPFAIPSRPSEFPSEACSLTVRGFEGSSSKHSFQRSWSLSPGFRSANYRGTGIRGPTTEASVTAQNR